MKAKARHIAGVIWGYARGETKSDQVVNHMVRNSDNLKVCSCAGCGNPRHSGWYACKTRKEIQAQQDLIETARQGAIIMSRGPTLSARQQPEETQ